MVIDIDFNNSSLLLSLCMLVGIIAASIRGVEKAISAEMDFVGVVLVGCITANGGGTIRDIFLQTDVYWLQGVYYIWISLGVAVGSFFLIKYRKSKINYKEFKYFNVFLDAVAIAAFTLAGVQKSINFHYGITISLLLALITSAGGGLIADMIANKVPVVLCTGMNLTISAISCLLYFFLIRFMDAFNASTIIIVFAICAKLVQEKYTITIPK